MPDNRDLDQPGRSDDPAAEDDIVGLEEDDDELEDLDEDDEQPDEQAGGRELADVVGDEGGSPGERPS